MEIEKLLREMIQQAVDERINSVEAMEDRMVRAHGEFVSIARAADLLNVSTSTIRRMLDDGRLIGTIEGQPLVMVRSMAQMTSAGITRKQKYPEFAIIRR